MFILAPSLLACDFSALESEIKKVYINGEGCEYLHLDIMDGVFVNNISFGLPVIESIRKVCKIIFDTHLMIINPVRYIGDFANAGCDIITFHFEACENGREILKTIDEIKRYNKKCGVSLNPGTDISVLAPYLDKLDIALIMSVEPGFGGQKFIESSLDKIKDLYKIKKSGGYKFKIEVDGGVTLENAGKIKEAGVDIIVAGSSIFKSADIAGTIEEFMNV
ncbi:MAG: ribulose-phosphate 3-epimerase [Oscillospiraceae bacterium]|nr:ribulose-phosphate 3-epimerase [Oscillospiraceae bacterium]